MTRANRPGPGRTGDAAFRKGAFDLQVVSGVLFSVQRTTFLRPNLDYDLGVVRLGYMLDNVYGSGFLRATTSSCLKQRGGSIFTGPGTALGGLSLGLPAQFSLSDGPGAAGALFSTRCGRRLQRRLPHAPPARVGIAGRVRLQADLGLRFRLTPKWSLDTEFDFRHLSNADFAGRNYGTNDLGGLIGASWSF